MLAFGESADRSLMGIGHFLQLAPVLGLSLVAIAVNPCALSIDGAYGLSEDQPPA